MTAERTEMLEEGVAMILDAAEALGTLDRDTMRSLAADDFRRRTLSGFLRRIRFGADEALRALEEDAR